MRFEFTQTGNNHPEKSPERDLMAKRVDPHAKCRFIISARPEAGAQARRALHEWMPSNPRLDDAQLALTELVNNAVLHAGLDNGEMLQVEFEALDGHNRFTVRHSGKPFEAVERPPSREAGASRGLAIVGRIADRWGVDGSDDQVWAWFELSRETADVSGA
ncbi:MAG: ATP-binding protein [Acidimicrobiia bacterium]